MSAIGGIENGRASYAYDCALKAKTFDNCKCEYKSYVKNIPAMIKINGLGATLAFIKSKQKNDANKKEYAYKLIYDQIDDWLKLESKGLVNLGENDDLVRKIIELPSQNYRAVTIEILGLFSWIRRFAEGLIKEQQND